MSGQQVWGWGWLSWTVSGGSQTYDAISELSIKQLCCSDRSLLILTRDGKVYFMYFCSETPCPQVVEGKILGLHLQEYQSYYIICL